MKNTLYRHIIYFQVRDIYLYDLTMLTKLIRILLNIVANFSFVKINYDGPHNQMVEIESSDNFEMIAYIFETLHHCTS